MANEVEVTSDPEPAGPTPSRRAWPKGFWSLMATQFQGAFSDNIFRTLVTFILIGMNLPDLTPEFRAALVGGLFSLPFILFSMAGGFVADRFSKRSVTIATKVAEIVIMGLAVIALGLQSVPLLLVTVFLMGAQSAMFGPSKYGLLPELLPEKRLSWGNGLIELGTFLAVITGTVAGGLIFERFRGAQVWSGVVLVALAVVGTLTSRGIDRVKAADPTRRFRANPVGDLWAQIKLIRRDRVLWLAVVGNTYFFFIAALMQQYNIIFYGRDILHLSASGITLLMAGLAVGVGVGSYTAGHLSGSKIEYGLIPLGSLGMTILALTLAREGISLPEVIVLLSLFGFFSGFLIVPISALIQHRPDKEVKGAVIAAANLLSFVGIFLAAGTYVVLAEVVHLGPRAFFLWTAGITVAGTTYAMYLLPSAFLRFLLWIFTHTIYRIEVEGRDHIPDKGGALFVCNHMSLIDGLLLSASTDRVVRFIMYKGIYDLPIVKPFAKILRAIPVSSDLRPRELLKALGTARQAILDDDVVCIFAEGQITRIGQLLPFRRGFTRIMNDVSAPIVPVHLDGVWGSIFSYERGRFFWKIPKRLLYPVTVTYGKPMPPDSEPFEVRQVVQELGTAAWRHRRSRMKLLHRSFVASARRHPLRMAMADPNVHGLRFGTALVRTVFLARRLRPIWEEGEMAGILLPPSVGGALTNLAALLLGKVPVNLNYTSSAETLASCIRQCGLTSVVTSRAFLERVPMKLPVNTLYLEDIVARPRRVEKLSALFLALLPAAWLERAVGRRKRLTTDDLATVIFSSGSTGDPKGVMLTHYNVASNVAQLVQIFAFQGHDRILGILPFFHSFGFTAALSLPAAFGIGVVFYPNPLDAQTIGTMVRKYAVTFMLATPTFLQAYIKRCEPEDFGSLEYVVTGAEKLPERVAVAFEDRFGIRPMEGYGCTECSPVVTVSTHDFRAAGFRQVGAKRGKIGHPLPGISVRIVDPDSGQPMPVGEPGMMHVAGPNIMRGYLNRPEQTAAVMQDGWYVTGDIAVLDEDGFVEIRDRLSRFSKIGGEMVPHLKIEETLHELAGTTEQTFAVTGVPDQTKGERLVVLHTLPEEQLTPVLERLAKAELPNLWIPRPGMFFRVESLPYLGSGKLDLRQVREKAKSALQQSSVA